jgi:cytochrome bd-type quinol oxidase subunit 1
MTLREFTVILVVVFAFGYVTGRWVRFRIDGLWSVFFAVIAAQF